MADTTKEQQAQQAIEAAVFRRLRDYLATRTDVQNIDMMNLAGFCRNCLSRWYQEEAEAMGLEPSPSAGRDAVYQMPYDEWKKLYQKEAGPEQIAAFKESQAKES